ACGGCRTPLSCTASGTSPPVLLSGWRGTSARPRKVRRTTSCDASGVHWWNRSRRSRRCGSYDDRTSRAAATAVGLALTGRDPGRLELGHRVNSPACGCVARTARFVNEGTGGRARWPRCGRPLNHRSPRPVSGRAASRSSTAIDDIMISPMAEVVMTNVLIRGLSDTALGRIDAEAAALGLSRNEFLRRRLEGEVAQRGDVAVTPDAWSRSAA